MASIGTPKHKKTNKGLGTVLCFDIWKLMDGSLARNGLNETFHKKNIKGVQSNYGFATKNSFEGNSTLKDIKNCLFISTFKIERNHRKTGTQKRGIEKEKKKRVLYEPNDSTATP